ncbi:hypothetical protein D0Z67_03545 [Streptomyces seoulensis]|uniref:Uncharacterized protein n=1 Tax=Streptomyces seoulensis TaxID=73044 RepID=A0A4P6TQH2_STRSO|nr:hypothetical protein D0Z67_03545 [Streptomyces seoulensis]
MIGVWSTAVDAPQGAENRSTWDDASAMICVMFRYAFLAASALADAPKAAVLVLVAAVDGARS